jgi:hypothetical protein
VTHRPNASLFPLTLGLGASVYMVFEVRDHRRRRAAELARAGAALVWLFFQAGLRRPALCHRLVFHTRSWRLQLGQDTVAPGRIRRPSHVLRS